MTLADVAALERALERGWIRPSVVHRARKECEARREKRDASIRRLREAVRALMGSERA